MSQEEEQDEDYFLPLEDQRVFGAGIRRKRVQFVRSAEHELNTTVPSSSSASTPSATSIADKYLSIVLKPKTATSPSTPTEEASAPLPPRSTQSAPPAAEAVAPPPPPPPLLPPADTGTETETDTAQRCEVCNLPLSTETPSTPSSSLSTHRPHEASLAHQLCLTHSHPPSHLDRTRAGLRYLSTYGWDPDSRTGLGAPGREGIREPLKGRVKNDTVGLGAGVGRDADGDPIPVHRRPVSPPKKVQRLNSKQVRRQAAEARKRGDRLRNLFFQSDDVLKFLGEGP
ncbi:hypothetical protein N7474_001099 [Penicillium riverlandense]|uniref:uncharacterized protein n=1 Tax=Penicillium riverlandense TaxID=1903569 RepID=UPI0025491361|nr:uncharacterized protein N7474_001099 [Penicillium riverlandense]KAJ5832788.1 hypothetical protein N7474_001099 [Penicillium riverlandense]